MQLNNFLLLARIKVKSIRLLETRVAEHLEPTNVRDNNANTIPAALRDKKISLVENPLRSLKIR